jgi:capsular polysaccharide biosynthesis protein
LATHSSVILQQATAELPNAVAYTNVMVENPEFARHLERHIYVPRVAELAGVSLVALPRGATVIGGGEFILKVDNILASEQYPIYFPLNEERIETILAANMPVQDVGKEVFLAARYGMFTWGHWLGELLPKVVLAEMLHPGRFSFALPQQVLNDRSPNLPWMRIRESLMAYGIEDQRNTPLDPARDYRFASLFAMTSVWSDHLMHPGAMAAMRTKIRIRSEESPHCRLAIERVPGYGRDLSNYETIKNMLLDSAFEVRRTGAMPFQDQVALFRGADLVFSILGSDLTNLIYSPDGVRVITAAPAIFGDRFFYALILGRQGRQIDLRGPVTANSEGVKHKSPFAVDPAEIKKAIELFTNALP